jgi:hypothetical protein
LNIFRGNSAQAADPNALFEEVLLMTLASVAAEVVREFIRFEADRRREFQTSRQALSGTE